jgi:hypothetical protein
MKAVLWLACFISMCAHSQCYPPPSPTEGRCYDVVGVPLVAIRQQLGEQKWSRVDESGRFTVLYQNDKCWHVVDWKAGTKSYCIIRQGVVTPHDR